MSILGRPSRPPQVRRARSLGSELVAQPRPGRSHCRPWLRSDRRRIRFDRSSPTFTRGRTPQERLNHWLLAECWTKAGYCELDEALSLVRRSVSPPPKPGFPDPRQLHLCHLAGTEARALLLSQEPCTLMSDPSSLLTTARLEDTAAFYKSQKSPPERLDPAFAQRHCAPFQRDRERTSTTTGEPATGSMRIRASRSKIRAMRSSVSTSQGVLGYHGAILHRHQMRGRGLSHVARHTRHKPT